MNSLKHDNAESGRIFFLDLGARESAKAAREVRYERRRLEAAQELRTSDHEEC